MGQRCSHWLARFASVTLREQGALAVLACQMAIKIALQAGQADSQFSLGGLRVQLVDQTALEVSVLRVDRQGAQAQLR